MLVPRSSEVAVRSVEALEAELAALQAELAALRARSDSPRPLDFVQQGWVDEEGVQSGGFVPRNVPAPESGLKAGHGVAHRASRWAVVVLKVRNLPGEEPWAPGSAWLIGASGIPVKARSVRLDRPRLASGELGFLFVELGALPPDEMLFRLELVDREGQRRLLIDGVEFQERPADEPGETP